MRKLPLSTEPPFALSLSKGRSSSGFEEGHGFDNLSPNGNVPSRGFWFYGLNIAIGAAPRQFRKDPLMPTRTLLAAALLLFFGSAPALACRTGFPYPGLSVIHTELPDTMPNGAIALEVELSSTDLDLMLNAGIPARVRRVIAGEIAASEILVRASVFSIMFSCTGVFSLGSSGILVGRVIGMDGQTPVVEPFIASERNGYRLTRSEINAE